MWKAGILEKVKSCFDCWKKCCCQGGVRVEGEGVGQSGVTESYTAQSVVISTSSIFLRQIRPFPTRSTGPLPRTLGRAYSQNCRTLHSSEPHEDTSLLLEVNFGRLVKIKQTNTKCNKQTTQASILSKQTHDF